MMKEMLKDKEVVEGDFINPYRRLEHQKKSGEHRKKWGEKLQEMGRRYQPSGLLVDETRSSFLEGLTSSSPRGVLTSTRHSAAMLSSTSTKGQGIPSRERPEPC